VFFRRKESEEKCRSGDLGIAVHESLKHWICTIGSGCPDPFKQPIKEDTRIYKMDE
jgi:hypothetical protein